MSHRLVLLIFMLILNFYAQSVLCSLRLELAELPDDQHMTDETLDKLTQPIATYYSAVSPATSAASESYLPIRTAILMSTLSITLSLLTFSISFTHFRRQWRCFITHPQKYFWGHQGASSTLSTTKVKTTNQLIQFLRIWLLWSFKHLFPWHEKQLNNLSVLTQTTLHLKHLVSSHVFTRMCQPVSFRKQTPKLNFLSVFQRMSSFVSFSAN